MKGYKFAVAWVAENDNAGNGDSVEDIQSYITTALVADIYGKDDAKVAQDIAKYREENLK